MRKLPAHSRDLIKELREQNPLKTYSCEELATEECRLQMAKDFAVHELIQDLERRLDNDVAD